MKKRDLLERIEALEQRITLLDRPLLIGNVPTVACTCGKPWHATVPPPPCPVHGAVIVPYVTYTTSDIQVERLQ